ncbi:MAG: ABC transporter permease [Candidatus Saccharimonadales bacterium]|jgi:ABC-2 type transport system permease protein/oleandomycin transport system permease protein
MGLFKSLYKVLRDTGIITRRNLMRYVRLPRLLFFSSIQPVMFLLLFNYVFGGALASSIHVPGGKYIDYLLPGILVQMVMFGGVQTGIGLADDMSKGIVDRFRSLPMSRLAVVAGRTLADAVRNVVVVLIMIAVGYLIGFHFHSGPVDAVGMVGVAVLFGYALSWVFALVGMAVHDPETAQLASFVFIFPLTFASAAFIPVQTMPSWLQVFVRNQPVTFVANSARHLALGVPDGGATWKILLWCIGLLVVFIPLAIRQYQRAVA